MLRFGEPAAGSIRAGGVPLATLDPAAWRSQVAGVGQRPYLFHGTVADNIRLARPAATDEEVVAAARAAYADAFICDLALGYATPVGEHGARLSGGEWGLAVGLALAGTFWMEARKWLLSRTI